MSISEFRGLPYHATSSGTSEHQLAWIALGSNLGPRELTLKRAITQLDALAELQVVATSRFYRTPAWGPPAPDYLNAVIRVETQLGPLSLLEALLRIERSFGRARTLSTPALSPRPLDLDLLLYGEGGALCLEHPALLLPHPRLHERRFVLEPLAELDPELMHPYQGQSMACLLRALPQ